MQNYKNYLQIGVIVSLSVLMTGCMGCTRVTPGYAGILSTVAGTDRGLKDVAVGPAWVFYNPFTQSVFEYPTSAKTAVWTHNLDEGNKVNEEITFTNKDKMQIAADISLAYQVLPDKIPAFYLKFRSDDLQTFTDGIMRNWAREKFDNVAGKYGVNEIMGDNAVFLKEVRDQLQRELDNVGVQLIQFGFIGAPRPPAAVQQSFNESVQATQIATKKQNELIQTQADAAKAVASAKGRAEATLVEAEAQAKSNRLLSESITPTLVNYRMLDKWDGRLPQVQSGGGGGGGGIMLQLPQK